MRNALIGRRRLGAAVLVATLIAGALPAGPVVFAQDGTGTIEVEAIGGLLPDVTATCGGPATDSDPEGGSIDLPFDGASAIEAPAGSCDLSWTEPSGEPNGVRVAVEDGRTTWVRAALIVAPWSDGRRLIVTDQAGTIIWDDNAGPTDRIWVLPGLHTVSDGTGWTLEVQALPGLMTLAGVSVDRPAPSLAPEPTPTPTPRPTVRPTVTPRPTTTRVPDLVGLDLADAGTLARRYGLRLAVVLQETTDVDPGIVLQQTPRAGTAAVEGDIVRVVVSRAAQQVAVPDVSLLTEDDAITILLDAGLTPGRRTTRTSVDVPEGRVITTVPAPGTLVVPGSSVSWIASSGAPAGSTPRPTPDFTTPPLETATPAPTASPTPTASPQPTAAPTATPRPTRTPRPTPRPTAPPTPTPTPSPSPTPTAAPVETPSAAALIEVPDVSRRDRAEAEQLITDAGLVVGRVQERANRNVPAGQVIRSVPPAGTLVDPGSTVRLVVSTGAPVASTTPSAAPTREPLPTPEPTVEPSAPPTATPSAFPSPAVSAVPGAHLAAVQAAGVLRVNLVPDGSAWSSTNAQGEPAGFEAQVARRIARQLGVEVAFTSVPPLEVLDGSSFDQFDLALGRLPGIEPVRLAFQATTPYVWDPLTIAVAADRAPAPEDLTDLAVCVVDQSAAQSWLEGTSTLTDLAGTPVRAPAVVTLPVASAQECVDAVAAGAADAWIDGRPTIEAATADSDALVIDERTLAVVPIAGIVDWAASPDTSLTDAVNAAIVTLQDNGQLARLSDRAFGADLVTGPPEPALPGESSGIPELSPEPSPIAATTTGRS